MGEFAVRIVAPVESSRSPIQAPGFLRKKFTWKGNERAKDSNLVTHSFVLERSGGAFNSSLECAKGQAMPIVHFFLS